jgi:hypothetical protein
LSELNVLAQIPPTQAATMTSSTIKRKPLTRTLAA